MRQSPSCNEKAVDPVCGMAVDPAASDMKTVQEGRTYYFCAPACRDAFTADPSKYLHPKKKGIWGRYMDRLQKATGGKAMKCH